MCISLIHLHTRTFTLTSDNNFCTNFSPLGFAVAGLFLFFKCIASLNNKLLHSSLSPTEKWDQRLSIDSGIHSGADAQNDCVHSAAPAAQNQQTPAYKPSNHLVQRISIRLHSEGEKRWGGSGEAFGGVGKVKNLMDESKKCDHLRGDREKPDDVVSRIVLVFLESRTVCCDEAGGDQPLLAYWHYNRSASRVLRTHFSHLSYSRHLRWSITSSPQIEGQRRTCMLTFTPQGWSPLFVCTTLASSLGESTVGGDMGVAVVEGQSMQFRCLLSHAAVRPIDALTDVLFYVFTV